MSTAVLTKPRTLNHDASMRIISFTRTDWRTWLAACLFPCKLYVALAFIWVIKRKMDLPNFDNYEYPWYLAGVIARDGFCAIAGYVASGDCLCLISLVLGMLIQVGIGANRAALASGLFAAAALIIGLMIMHFASSEVARCSEIVPDIAALHH